MKRLTMMVTPDGRWVFPDSDEFRAALGDPNPDYDAISFAVKNLGFIKFNIIEQSMIEIDLHPRNVELPALLAVQQQLHSAQVRLFRIKYFDSQWKSEISSSSGYTIERLSQLCTPSYTPEPTDRFIVEPQDFTKLFEKEDCLFRPLAQKWRMSFGHFDPSVIALAVRHQLLSRLMIIGVNSRPGEAVFRFIGDGFRWTDSDFQLRAIGERVENQPDRDYGAWVSPFYRSVAMTGEPRYDRIKAVIKHPDPESWDTRMIHYDRLLLPWKTPSSEVLVTLTSEMIEEGAAASRSVSEPERSVKRNLARSS